MARRKKTDKMLKIEAMLGEQLEVALPRLVTESNLSRTAEYLGISKATLGYWLLKMDIETMTVALGPGDTVDINRNGKRHRQLTDTQFRAMMDLMMVSDPWPLGEPEHAQIENLLIVESERRGYDSWIVAYHEVAR